MSPLAVALELPEAASGDLRELDYQLARRCVAGDETAWREMVDRYGRLVYSVCLAAGLAPPEAEDVCREVMLSALHGLRSYGGCRLSTWLYRITRRRIADFLRSSRRREGPAGLPGDSTFPAVRAEREARFKGWVEPTCEYERVRQELARLEEPERSVMVAFHIAEVPVREIASDIGLPENTVKSHLRRARLKLRRRLGGIE